MVERANSSRTLREIIEMAQKVEDQNSVMQQAQGFKFEPSRGSSSNKTIGFRLDYH